MPARVAHTPGPALLYILQALELHEYDYRDMIDYRTFPLLPTDLQCSHPSPPGCRRAAASRRVPVTFMLNPQDWFDVLYFVNRFAIQYGGGDAGFALQAERMIAEQLPPGVRVRRQVEDWLLQHWRLAQAAPAETSRRSA